MRLTIISELSQENRSSKFVVCLNNEGYEASLEIGKIYQIIEDSDAYENGLIRLIDESGEDYAFSADRFCPIESNRYPLRGLSITIAETIADNFDEPRPELSEALSE